MVKLSPQEKARLELELIEKSKELDSADLQRNFTLFLALISVPLAYLLTSIFTGLTNLQNLNLGFYWRYDCNYRSI